MTETLSPLHGDNVPISDLPPKTRRQLQREERTLKAEKPLIEDQPDNVEKPKMVYRPGVLVRPLTELYENIGGMIILFDQPCGQAIVASANACAKSLDELARTNVKVRNVLMRLVQTGVLGKLIAAHLPIILAVVAHHFPKVLIFASEMMSRLGNNAEEE